MNTGARNTHSSGKPSMNGKIKKVSVKPSSAPSKVPQAIWNDMRRGLLVVADSATVAAETRVMVAPLGQAVATQYALMIDRMNVARSPAARAVIQLVLGRNDSCHCSRAWL